MFSWEIVKKKKRAQHLKRNERELHVKQKILHTGSRRCGTTRTRCCALRGVVRPWQPCFPCHLNLEHRSSHLSSQSTLACCSWLCRWSCGMESVALPLQSASHRRLLTSTWSQSHCQYPLLSAPNNWMCVRVCVCVVFFFSFFSISWNGSLSNSDPKA